MYWAVCTRLLYKQCAEASSCQVQLLKQFHSESHCSRRMQAHILVYLTHTHISHLLTQTHPSHSGTVVLEQYQFHLSMHHVCFKIHENHTRSHSYLSCQLGYQ